MDRLLMPLLIALLLCFGLALGVHAAVKRGLLRGHNEADERLEALFADEEVDDELYVAGETVQKAQKARRSVREQIALWLASLRYFNDAEGEGHNVVAQIERQLALAGMRTEAFGPYQALAASMLIWAVAIVVSLVGYSTLGLPWWLAAAFLAFGIAYPWLKLRGAKNKRRQAIEREVPRFIRQLSMALSSRQVTLPDAVERVVSAAAASPRRSPLAEEFGRAYAEHRHGRLDFNLALQGVAARTGVPTVEHFVTALVAGQSTGADIRATLEGASQQAQEMFKQATREKIAKSETKFIFSLFFTFLGALPLFIGPVVVSALASLGH
jgi:Flp pilus assembly protein TadB